MKCPACNGTGLVYNALGDFEEDCGYCHGKGNVAEPHTNEDWFCGLSTEEKVKALLDLRERIRQKMRAELGSENKFYKGDYYREWLKEKHNE